MKLYDFETEFEFGQFKGQKLKDVFLKSPSYVNWCFQKVDWFCITDDIFNKLPIIIALSKENKLDNVKEQKDWLKILVDLHNVKKSKLNVENNHTVKKFYDDIHDDNENYYYKNWLAEAAGTDDPEVMNDVYWNLD
jgi:hypothetical protein